MSKEETRISFDEMAFRKASQQGPNNDKQLVSDKTETVPVKEQIPVRKLAAIMITDIVDFSKQMEIDQEHTYSKLLIHHEIVRKNISRYRREEIKTIGDSFLIQFKSAVDAVKVGISIQNDFKEYNKDKKEVDQILLRIGIHIGDIFIEDNDIFGDGVNVASRIEPLADTGGICISADVYNVVKKIIDIEVLSLGIKELKNIKEPPEIYKVIMEASN